MNKSNTDAMKNSSVKNLKDLGKLLGNNEPNPDNALPADPNGPILMSEGLDMCIYKLCMDRRNRGLYEIGDELAVYGFRAVEVRDRVVKLTNHKNWFDKTGTGGNIRYAMKKTTKMPLASPPANPSGIKLRQDPVAGVDVNYADDPYKFQLEVHQMEQQREQEEQQQSASVAPSPAMENKPVVEAAKPEVVVTPKVEERAGVDHGEGPPMLSEGLKTCIWKIMRDFHSYTTADICVLLCDEMGVNKSTVINLMSRLHTKEDWFVVSTNDQGVRLHILRDTIEKPVNDKPYQSRSEHEVPATSPAADDKSEQQQLQLEQNNTPVVADDKPVVEDDEPTVRFSELEVGDLFTLASMPEHYVLKKVGNTTAHIHVQDGTLLQSVEILLAEQCAKVMAEEAFDSTIGQTVAGEDTATSDTGAVLEKLGNFSQRDIARAGEAIELQNRGEQTSLYVGTTGDRDLVVGGQVGDVIYNALSHSATGTQLADAMIDAALSGNAQLSSQDLGALHYEPAGWAIPQPSFAMAGRVQPVKVYGESEVRIPTGYSIPKAPKAPEQVPAMEECELDADSELVQFVVKIGDVELSIPEAKATAKKLVNHGYGPGRKERIEENSSLVQFNTIIKGKIFTPEQTQEIACSLVSKGFTE